MNEIANSGVQKDDNLMQDSQFMDNTANHLADQTKCEALSTTSASTAPSADSIAHNWRICLVGPVNNDEDTVLAAQQLNLPILTSETGGEYIADDSWITYFVLRDFDGPIYDAIYKSKHKIMGPPALQQAVSYKEAFNLTRPVYNFCMKGIVTCFTGVRKKDELIRLVNLIHSMGGSIRKDMGAKVTHLICSTSDGEKYKYALTFRLSIVRPSWVLDAWERRHETNFKADIDEFSKVHRVKAFEGKRICFFGFPPDEHSHMVDVLRLNGGIPTEIDDPECTHVVVDEHIVHAKPDPKNGKTHILKCDWFWYTIQNGIADEAEYKFGDYLDSITNTPGGDRRDSLPISFNKRKRKRLSTRPPQDGGTPVGVGKRRSSVSDAGLLSVSGSFLDCTVSPDKVLEVSKHIIEPEPIAEQPKRVLSMRQNHFMDFFQTESNYVGILDTIVTLFKEPLERMLEVDPDDALLNKSELKSIFSNFIPIHEVHKAMLHRIKELEANWSEECLIGQIILEHKEELIKAYPPYVNFFEQMKETLQYCDVSKPRFHAFLKICQAKPECGRQNLKDLMIRPVQRLPSISLLLSDIVKHTPKNNPDFKKLDDALKAIKEVMTYINEDKRKVEGQMAMFDIFNEIDNCPAQIVSSHRSFVSRCDVTELTDSLSGRGDSLVLFLFNDSLEICKKRSRAFTNAKSPSTMNGINAARSNCQQTKPFKHVRFMPLSSIRLVVDIRDSSRAFALNCRATQDNKDRLYSFSINDDENDKQIYLRQVCKQLAENACKADADKFMISLESDELGIDTTDINVGTLSKAFKFATKTRLKVGRAFSFNKTPAKIKRAVSTIMTSPFGSTHSLTPASQLANMKLASCTNINEVGEEDPNSATSPNSKDLIAPMSVQPMRKNKNPVPLSALRRL